MCFGIFGLVSIHIILARDGEFNIGRDSEVVVGATVTVVRAAKFLQKKADVGMT